MRKKAKNSVLQARILDDVLERFDETVPTDGQLKGTCLTYAAELWIALPEPVRKLLLANMISIEDVAKATSKAANDMLTSVTLTGKEGTQASSLKTSTDPDDKELQELANDVLRQADEAHEAEKKENSSGRHAKARRSAG